MKLRRWFWWVIRLRICGHDNKSKHCFFLSVCYWSLLSAFSFTKSWLYGLVIDKADLKEHQRNITGVFQGTRANSATPAERTDCFLSMHIPAGQCKQAALCVYMCVRVLLHYIDMWCFLLSHRFAFHSVFCGTQCPSGSVSLGNVEQRTSHEGPHLYPIFMAS